MIRNKFKYILLSAVCALFFTSCDSYLDIQPVGKVIPTTADEYRELFNQAYYQPTIDKAIADFRSDIAEVRDNDTDLSDFNNIQLWNDNTGNSSSTREFGWEIYYSVIYNANVIIENQSKMKGDATAINQLVGEAYLMRAYQYFTLVNLYGQPYTKPGAQDTKAVPLNLDTDLEKVLGRNTVGEIYAQILKDIDAARSLMNVSNWEDRYKYRFSTVSVDALEARVRLYMGDWEAAYTAATKVLAAKSDLEDFNNATSLLPTSFKSVEAITAGEQIYTGTNTSATRAKASLIAEYDTINDLRYHKFYTPVSGKTYYTPLKASTSSEFRSTFRTAEFYLIAAETAARTNKTAEARSNLLTLIKHRYTPAGYAAKATAINAMTAAELLNEALLQRKLELAFEGQRWFDLRRTDRPSIVKTSNGTTFTLQQDDPRYTLAIPVSATGANPKLKN